jgi:hypothetical protein
MFNNIVVYQLINVEFRVLFWHHLFFRPPQRLRRAEQIQRELVVSGCRWAAVDAAMVTPTGIEPVFQP